MPSRRQTILAMDVKLSVWKPQSAKILLEDERDLKKGSDFLRDLNVERINSG